LFSRVDYAEVGRKAHELEVSRGRDDARRYAANVAADALTEGDMAAHAFWSAVESSLTLR